MSNVVPGSSEEEARALLAAHPYVGANVEDVAELLSACPERKLSPGESLCKERSHGDEMYFLTSGEVEVRKHADSGEEHVLAVIAAPEVLRQLALVDNAVRSASIFAREGAVVRVLDRATYVRVVNVPTLMGSALRRLVLASLHRQLSGAHSRLEARLAPDGTPLGRLPAAHPPPPGRPLPDVFEDDPDDTAEIEIALTRH